MSTFDKTIGISVEEEKHSLTFRLFKYAIYVLLAYDIVLFFGEDLAASAITFTDAVTWRNVVEAYTATFDTAAWVILLLMFELETAVIPDKRLQGALKWGFLAVRAVCYFFIVYAFFGYVAKYELISLIVPFNIDDVCSLIGTDFTFVADLDDYLPIDWVSCGVMQGASMAQVAGTHIIGTTSALEDATRLAMVDIVNAADWLIIVVMLEVEVLAQLNRQLTDRTLRKLNWVKGFLYLILLMCAVYWLFNGDILDFWDALLWLIAFVFIELNIFRWHAEEGGLADSGFYPLSRT